MVSNPGTFHLVDLRSQGPAVERALAMFSDEEKLVWLSTRGSLTERSIRFGGQERTLFEFVSPAGREARFFLNDGQFMFV